MQNNDTAHDHAIFYTIMVLYNAYWTRLDLVYDLADIRHQLRMLTVMASFGRSGTAICQFTSHWIYNYHLRSSAPIYSDV